MARRGGEETPIPKKTCFVICPIGDEGGDERKWSDDLLDCIITPVVEKMGYQKPIRADHINESGIITRQIIDLLIESDLVIADLSYRNPNVCYELAVRHVAKRPFIHMIKNGHKIPFDTASNRAITVDIDIRSANKAKKELERHISSIESGNIETDNPIGTALTLRDLKSSGDPSQMMSANLMEAIQNIATEVKALRDVRLNPYQIVGRGVNLAGLAPVMSIRLNDRQGELMKQYFEVSRKILDQKANDFPQKVIAESKKELNEIVEQLNATGMSTQEVLNLRRNYDLGSDF